MLLTSLANVRQWVGSSTTTDDALLTRMITFASQQIQQHVQRPDFGLTTISETISGRGQKKIQLRNYPVLSVNSLTICGVTIPASTGPTVYGYFLEPVYGSVAGRPQNVGIVGGNLGPMLTTNAAGGIVATMPVYGSYSPRSPFPPGIGNITTGYTYGYAIQNEPYTVSSTGSEQYTPLAPYGSWGADNGVSYKSSGAALTAVASAPTVGQYVPPNLSGDSPTLYYQFAAADVGQGVLINYSYVPAQVEQACIETVGERYRYKSRIGQRSESLGGEETATYDLSGLPAAVIEMLAPFELVAFF